MLRRETPLSSTAPFDRLSRGRLLGRFGFRIGQFKAAQNFVGGVLQPCIRLVELTGCLACQLTELVAIGHMRKCLKNKIGTHCLSPSFSNACPGERRFARRVQQRGAITNEGYPKLQLPSLRRTLPAPVQKHLGPLHVMKWMPYRIGFAVCAPDTRAPVWPFRGAPKKRTQGINGALRSKV